MSLEKLDNAWGVGDEEDDPFLAAAKTSGSPARSEGGGAKRVFLIISTVLLLVVVLITHAAVSSSTRAATAPESAAQMMPTPVHVVAPILVTDVKEAQQPTPVLSSPVALVSPTRASHHATMLQGKLLDTRPAIPTLLPAPSGMERYISYMPHSGLHNQRIELQNAVLLAHLTNRTLLVPLARLGRPLPWVFLEKLMNQWHKQQKSRLTRCKEFIPQLEAKEDIADKECQFYTAYAQVSWEFLLDLDHLKVPVRLVERNELERSWFTSADGLNLQETAIYTFEDPVRYSWRLYDDAQSRDMQQQYKHRLDVGLLNTDYAKYKLLEFGSLFGSSRWILHKAENVRTQRAIDSSFTFSMPILDEVADAIEALLGGRSNFIGLHLRVGNGPFERNAPKVMPEMFRTLCTTILRVDKPEIDRLISEASHQRRHTKRILRRSNSAWAYLDSSKFDGSVEVPFPTNSHWHRRQRDLEDSSKLACRKPLHTAPRLQALNTRIYIATDSASPETDPVLATFRHALPCIHFLHDFRDLVPALPALDELRSKEEGVKMVSFLLPLLEALLAARGRLVMGTKGSTFSRYVTTVLHDKYWPSK